MKGGVPCARHGAGGNLFLESQRNASVCLSIRWGVVDEDVAIKSQLLSPSGTARPTKCPLDLGNRDQRFSETSSGQDFLGDGAVDVCQSKIAAAVAIGQFFVVESHQVQHRGVQVVNVHAFFDVGKTEFFG